MPHESQAYVIIIEPTSPYKSAIYVIPCTREEAERLRKRGIKTEGGNQ